MSSGTTTALPNRGIVLMQANLLRKANNRWRHTLRHLRGARGRWNQRRLASGLEGQPPTKEGASILRAELRLLQGIAFAKHLRCGME